MNLEPYTDVYFLRSLQILQHYRLNPIVRAQIFIRQGPGVVVGISEAYQIITDGSHFFQNGGKFFALEEESNYDSGETVLVLEGRAQDVIPLETVILGIISSRTTQLNDKHSVDLSLVTQRVQALVLLVDGRPIYYFGARHWHYLEDAHIAQAAFAGGAAAASTDIGASVVGQKGIGTIPHSLENIFAWKYGRARAVLESTKAFDEVIPASVPRIALVDYANAEIDDAVGVAKVLGEKLSGIRVDTSGDTQMQGAETRGDQTSREYWYGLGVTISGVCALRQALNAAGFEKLTIILSSGFANLDKVRAFTEAEKVQGLRLFDGLGVGNLFAARIATMDIVGVGDDVETIEPVAKVGRSYKPNPRLALR